MAVTMNSATFMGKNFQDNQNSIVNTTDLTLKKMFDISSKFVGEQDEISNVDTIHWEKHSWKYLSLIVDETIINLQRAKVCLVRSVLCLGKIHQHPKANESWKDRIEWITTSQSYRDYDGISGEPTEFEWNIFPGFTTLQLCGKVTDLLSRLGETSEIFTGRILLVSMFNDISCEKKDNEEERMTNAKVVSILTRKFGMGQWSFVGPGSEKKWYSMEENSPQGIWDHIAEKMLVELAESGCPIFRATTPLSRGKLKSKGHGKLSIHFAADQETIETIFRITVSANQLSLYGAVANMCEECESLHDRSGQLDKVMGQSIVLSVIKTEVPLENDIPSHQNLLLQRYEERIEMLSQENKVRKFCMEAGFNLARIGRPDILWSVNKLARSITKWTKACDKRLNRLISYIHHTCKYRQYCPVGNTAKQCRLGLFQDSDFEGDLEDSKSTSGGTLCIFGSHTFVPRSWMCKKQTAVSHSSTESEIISLDTGLRLDGLHPLELWDLIVSVLGNISCVSDRSGKLESDDHKHHNFHKKIDVTKDIDTVPSNVQSARQEALLYVFEDNEAVIKMIMKGRSPTMRHVSRTHRVALDWLFDRINLDPKIQIKYIDTKNQLADILTKGNFTRDEWNHLLTLFNISHFSSTSCIAATAKRAQQESGEERVTAKSRLMMNLTARMPSIVSSSTS